MPQNNNRPTPSSGDRQIYHSVNHTGRRPQKARGRTVDSYSASATHARRNSAPINTGVLLLCGLLSCLVLLSAIVILWNGEGEPVTPDTSGLMTGSKPSDNGDPVPGVPDNLKSETVTVLTESFHEGELILVNLEYAYTFPSSTELLSVNKNKNPYYITWYEFQLEKNTLEVFNRLMNDFYAATGCDRTMMNDAYRSWQDQEKVLQNRPQYATQPGHSEHHTGMAIDMQIYDPSYGDAKNSWYFYEYEPAAWLVENFDDYGFILRYPESDEEETQVVYEPWHYRYIGVPHAEICNLREDCMEEYIAYLSTLSFIGTRLYFDGETLTEGTFEEEPVTGYMIYYVPVEDGITTAIPIPEGCTSYKISGDNVGGFVVTVELGA